MSLEKRVQDVSKVVKYEIYRRSTFIIDTLSLLIDDGLRDMLSQSEKLSH